MKMNLKTILELYAPKAKDKQKFVDKHIVIKHKDANGNGDEVFKASNIKKINRKKEHHGYESGEDEAVYEETDFLEESFERAPITVNKKNYSWGKMITIHQGNMNTYPLHPIHQEKIRNLKDGETTNFTDETGSKIESKRIGDRVSFKKNGSNTGVFVGYHHFKEDIDNSNDTLSEGTMKLSKVHIVHHHDHPAAIEFAKHYTNGMKGDHREGGPTEADEKNSDLFHSRYTKVYGKSGFAGSGQAIYKDAKTNSLWKVDRHPNGKTFYGTDHIISHYTGPLPTNESLSSLKYMDKNTIIEKAINSFSSKYSKLSDEEKFNSNIEYMSESDKSILNKLFLMLDETNKKNALSLSSDINNHYKLLDFAIKHRED